MTGLQTLLGRMAGRTCIALVMAASVVALGSAVPIASADPTSDADAAITAAWDAGGGAAGPLGIKDGGVYPAGVGFGQNFASGTIFFTPESGAHAMQGAILDKYEALGGPVDGDLGFPNIDEGPGRAPGSRNTTFDAADQPVIFWTPDTGARVVRGPINAAWDALGGSAGVLGVPTEDEVYRGDDVSQTFTGGTLSWNRTSKAFATTPPELAGQLAGLEVPGDVTTTIDAARRAAGGPLGPLGAEDGGQYPIGPDGVGQNFTGGTIFYSPATGANVLTGQVLAKYESVGGPEGDLGYPTSNEGDGGIAPMSKIATFAAADQPVIFWTPDFGAVIVRGAMNAAWAKLGGATGELGAPTADQSTNGDVVSQTFSGGAISWDRTSNEFTTEPPALATQLEGLQVPGRDLSQAPSGADPAGDQAPWYRFSWWWLLGIVPVVVLVGVILAAVLLNRRRHDDRAPLTGFDDDEYDDYYDDDDDYDDGEDEATGDATADPEFDSGPIAVGVYRHDEDGAGRSSWAMPADVHGVIRGALHQPAGGGVSADGVTTDLDEDQDDVDTAPIHIAAPEAAQPTVRRYPWSPSVDAPAATDARVTPPAPAAEDVLAGAGLLAAPEPEPESGPPSGRHAAMGLDEPDNAETSMRLAVDDPFTPPPGYPIKADTKTGRYWTPDGDRYRNARAEIWFASEEFALTNGFTKG